MDKKRLEDVIALEELPIRKFYGVGKVLKKCINGDIHWC
jgi:hypothetical protein